MKSTRRKIFNSPQCWAFFHPFYNDMGKPLKILFAYRLCMACCPVSIGYCTHCTRTIRLQGILIKPKLVHPVQGCTLLLLLPNNSPMTANIYGFSYLALTSKVLLTLHNHMTSLVSIRIGHEVANTVTVFPFPRSCSDKNKLFTGKLGLISYINR